MRPWRSPFRLIAVSLVAYGCGGAPSAASNDSGVRDSDAPDGSWPDADASEPDPDAMGGSTPDVGADMDGGDSNSCVSVTGSGGEPWLDLQIIGRQFDAYDGRRIRVVASADVRGRRGVADMAIVSGAFELTIPATLEYGYYTEIALYVDNDADDTCDVGEPLWGFVTGIVRENLVVEVTPNGSCISGGGPSVGQGCRAWPAPVGPCVINGQADLTMRLPCPP